jgi:ketosteroid isomerase-like protein
VTESEHVQTARKALDASGRGDAEELIRLCHPDFEWRPFRAQLEGTVYRGPDGIRRCIADLQEDWSEIRIDQLELHEAGDSVVVIGQVHGRGRGSGVELDVVSGFIFEFEGGRPLRLTSHSDPQAALRELPGRGQP